MCDFIGIQLRVICYELYIVHLQHSFFIGHWYSGQDDEIKVNSYTEIGDIVNSHIHHVAWILIKLNLETLEKSFKYFQSLALMCRF